MQRLNSHLFFISFILWARLFRWTMAYSIGLALIGVVFYVLFIKLTGISINYHHANTGSILLAMMLIIAFVVVNLYVFSKKVFQKPVKVMGRRWQISVSENGRLLDLPLPFKNALALFWGLTWRTVLIAQVWRIAVYVVSLLLHGHGMTFPAKSVLPEIVIQSLAFWWLITFAYGNTRIGGEELFNQR